MQVSMRRSILWMGFSQGGLFVIQFGGSVVIARLLTPYEMGVYALAAATVGLLTALRVFGLGTFLIREPDATPEIRATVFTINAALSLAVSLGIIALSHLGAAVMKEPGVQAVMVLLALSPILGIFDMVPAAMLERHGAFKLLALGGLGKVAVGTVVTIWLAFQGQSYMSIAYGNLAGTVFGLVFNLVMGWRWVGVRVGLHDWRRITKYGVQVLAAFSLGTVSAKLPDIMMGPLLGFTALGLYSRASSLHSMLWEGLHQLIARIVFVDFSEQRRQGRPLRDTYLRVTAMMTALLWPAFAGLGILAGPVVLLVYGPVWTGAALPLSFLAVSGMVLVANTMAGEVYVVSNETGRLVRLEAGRTLAGSALFALGCLGGLGWAAAARICEAAIGVSLSRRDLLRLTGTRMGDYGLVYGQAAVLTLAACGPSAVLMAAHGWSERTPLPYVAAAVAAGVGMWAVALWLLRHPLFDEARILARQALRPLRDA